MIRRRRLIFLRSAVFFAFYERSTPFSIFFVQSSGFKVQGEAWENFEPLNFELLNDAIKNRPATKVVFANSSL